MAAGVALVPVEASTEPMADARGGIPGYRVLGVRIHAVQIPDAVRIMRRWVEEQSSCRNVVVTSMHGLTEAQHDRAYKGMLNSADLCVPDGWPVMMTGRLAGFPMQRRVYGPELMLAFIEHMVPSGCRHFFYGGAPGVADELARVLGARFPRLAVAGTFSPPYGPVAGREEPSVLERINASRADVVWVGLGTPKQERWMAWRKPHLAAPLLVGVGAAFDFHAGKLRQAPRWMREHGLEWLFRLGAEPRRLWKRYLLGGTEFAVRMLLELFTGRIKRCT